ncbi:MAG TPA: phospholipase D family protein [Luteibacter sp.]|jgi:phosphatidylserine/phosphatidylglycerophosphate/cardiolipin synthase-like enzyme|nr:phospholipase D family protein [Luteibacter sp.]
MRHFFTAVLLATLALAQGCTLSRAQIHKADVVVETTIDRQIVCPRTDRCAIDSPLLDAAKEAIDASTRDAPVHIVTLLEDGQAAMAARINLIRAAQHTIDVQTYIWEQDDAGWLILDELVHAAQRGVRVRILADQLFSFRDPKLLATLATANANLSVRLYNPTFHSAKTPPLEFAAGLVCCFFKFNQRMHNKLILVDDTIGITGGRNYENRYFDWDDSFDYIDRDIMVGGPAAKEMADSFTLFWQHKRSTPLTHLRDVNHLLTGGAPATPWQEPTYTRPERVEETIADAGDDAWLEDRLVEPSLRLQRVAYLSDLPAKTEEPRQRDAHELTRELMGQVAAAKDEVILQTPYLVLSSRAKKIFRDLQKRPQPTRVIVSTNSLASTDAFAVYALSYKHRKSYLTKYGFEIYEMKPHLPFVDDVVESEQNTIGTPNLLAGEKPAKPPRGLFGSSRRGARNRPAPLLSPGTRVGLHAKSLVVDDNFAMVGTHNFDPRSDHYNTESGVLVYDKRFADLLRASIMRDTAPDRAWVIAPRQESVPVLSGINQAISDISESLPFFDLWPFRYATSYDLKPGCIPVRRTDPRFFQCYEAVGDFPEVDLSFKLIYTRLITAFGSSVSGIL